LFVFLSFCISQCNKKWNENEQNNENAESAERKHPALSEEKTIIPEEYNTPNEKRKAKLNGGNNNLDAPVSPALPGSGHSDLD